MAFNNNPYMNYRNAKVETSSQGDLLVMLYDAALRFVKEIETHILSKDIAKKGIAVDNAFAVLNELQYSINYDHDVKLANNLNALYNFITSEISKANINNTANKIPPVIIVIEKLKDGWVAINNSIKKSIKEKQIY